MIFDSEHEIRMQENDYLNVFMQTISPNVWEYRDGALVYGRPGMGLTTITKRMGDSIKIRKIVSPSKNLTIYGDLSGVDEVHADRVIALKSAANTSYEHLAFSARMIEIHTDWMALFRACKFCCETLVFIGSFNDFFGLQFKGSVLHCNNLSLIITGGYPNSGSAGMDILNLVCNIFQPHLDSNEDSQINCAVMMENGVMETYKYKGNYNGITM